MNELEVRFTFKDRENDGETCFALVKVEDKYQLVGNDADGKEIILNLKRDSDTGLLTFADNPEQFAEDENIISERLSGLSSELTESLAQGLDISDNSEEGKKKPGYTPDQIYVENKPFSLKQLIDLIKDGDLELAPAFQRNFVWDKTRQSKLIESILLGLPLPSMYLSQYNDGRLTIVDGLQRINTIKSFLDGSLRLCNMEYLEDCNGKTFEELKDEKKLSMLQIRRFHQTQIMCYVIDYRSPTELKYDLFRRLNTGGRVLNDQEIRNCMSRVPVQKLLSEMSSLESFKQTTKKEVKDTRMAAQEAALRFIYFYDEYSNENSVGNYDGFMSKVLDKCVEKLNDMKEIELNKYKEFYDKSMLMSFKLFGENAFRKVRTDGRKRPINKLLMLVISVLLAKHGDEYICKNLSQEMVQLLENDDKLEKCISLHTSDKANIEYVFKCIKEKLFDKYLLNKV